MKQYQGEKAIISLTSWKARIKTVGLTIYSLLTQCPGFHIVLVLSEEEFPKKEAELPEDLVLMSRGGKIEILWVYRNYKSFKKVLFTMDKYRDVPIISADDDCIYTCNYAEELYRVWVNNKKCIVTCTNGNKWGRPTSWGYATLYPPHGLFKCEPNILKMIEAVTAVGCNHDDDFYIRIWYGNQASPDIISFHKSINDITVGHDDICALGAERSGQRIKFENEVFKAVIDKYATSIHNLA